MKRQLIFVFGSNEAGRHAKGAALEAVRDWGAVYGRAEGLQGTSYAIPTKGKKLQTLSLTDIQVYIDKFLNFALVNPQLIFMTTPIGTGLAGYKITDILPLFYAEGIPENVLFTNSWFKDIEA